MAFVSYAERKKVFIEKFGLEAWLKRKSNYAKKHKIPYGEVKKRFINKHGEEAWRKLEREKAQKRREKSRERLNEKYRDYYQKNRRHLIGIIITARRKREPHRGLLKAIREFKEGRITVNELVTIFDEAVTRSSARDG